MADSAPVETIRLKNGTEHQKELVASIRYVLEDLLAKEPIAFYELVLLCRQPGYTPFGVAGKPLLDRGLATVHGGGLQGDGMWQVHEAIREIVLCAVEGEGIEMRLVSPEEELNDERSTYPRRT